MAPDSFGGTLTAVEAAEAMRAGWTQVAPDDELVLLPMSDGGPGFVDVLSTVLDGQTVPVPTTDPLGRPVVGAVLVVGDTAYVESAQACGLHLLTAAERDPLVHHTYGLGALLAAAVECGAARSSSASAGRPPTTPAWACSARSASRRRTRPAPPCRTAGWRWPGWPSWMARPSCAARRSSRPPTWTTRCAGRTARRAVFGPQKGLSRRTSTGSTRRWPGWAEVAERDIPGAPAGLVDLPGAGAAGGLGAALLALGGTRRSGGEMIFAAVDLPGRWPRPISCSPARARSTSSPCGGRSPAGWPRPPPSTACPAWCSPGRCRWAGTQAAAAGVEAAYSVADQAGSVEAAMARPADRLSELAAHVAREWSRR